MFIIKQVFHFGQDKHADLQLNFGPSHGFNNIV